MRVLLAIFFSLFGIFTAFAQEITLSEYLDLVKTKHPFFEKEALNAEIDRMTGESLLGGQEWVFSIQPYYNRFGGVTVSPADGAHNAGGEVSVSKSIWETGGQLALSLESDYTKTQGVTVSNFTTFPPTSSKVDTDTFTQSITLSYIQPLLKNIGGKLNRLGYDLNAYNVKISEVNAVENQENFVLSVASKFIDWYYLTEQIRLSKERLALAKDQLEQTNNRFRANLVDKVDVIRAEDAIRSSEQGIIQLESQWKAKRAELAVIAQSDELNQKNPDYDLYSLQELPGIDESTARMSNNARILKPLKIAQAQLSHSRQGYKDRMLPDLTLTLSGSLKGSDEDFIDSLSIEHPDLHVDIELTIPSDYQAEKSNLGKIEIQQEQLLHRIKDLHITLESSLRNIMIQLEEMEKVLELNLELIKSAQERTNEELKLYNQGRGELNFVIGARDNEKNAKLNYAGNAAFYHKLVLEYRALMDELLEE